MNRATAPIRSIHEFEVRETHTVSHVDPRTRKRLTIEPFNLRIFVEQGSVTVVLDGRTVKKNGTYGQHPRTHLYNETSSEDVPSLTFDDLPEWAVPLLDHVLALHYRPDRETVAQAIYAVNPQLQGWNGDPYGFNERGAGSHRKRAFRQADAVLALGPEPTR